MTRPTALVDPPNATVKRHAWAAKPGGRLPGEGNALGPSLIGRLALDNQHLRRSIAHPRHGQGSYGPYVPIEAICTVHPGEFSVSRSGIHHAAVLAAAFDRQRLATTVTTARGATKLCATTPRAMRRPTHAS